MQSIFFVPARRFAGLVSLVLFAVVLAGCSSASSNTTAAPVVPGTISLSASTVTVAQPATSVALTITRTGGTSGAVSVNYATSNGTATAGTDYTNTTGSLVWNDGDGTSRTVTVPLTATPGFNGTRTFSVVLSSALNGASIGTATEVVSITGSGAPTPGVLGLSASTVTVAQATGTLTFTVTRTAGTTGAVAVSYATSNGTAVAGTDYTAASGTLSWATGDATSKTVTVPITATPGFSGSKTFAFTLSSPTNSATLGTAVETATITGTFLTPSNYFSFTFPSGTFKLQLPIDQFGGTGGLNNIQYPSIEASTAQLTAGFVDAYFYADTATYAGATNHIIFVAPSNGAATTPGSGSDHTRSELRELYTGTGADSNSDWNSNIGGTLTGSCTVQSVSVSSDEATIAQIHNQSYVFMLLMYRPTQKDIAVDIYSSLGGSSHLRTSMVQNVNLGDAVNYSIAYKNNSMTVTVNGTTQTFAIDPTWAGTPMYFKLGAYHAAPNIGNPAGDKTQVAYSSFAITHP